MIREAFKRIGVVLLNLCLVVLAFILLIGLLVPAIIWKIIVSITEENRKARDILDGTSIFFRAIAITIDVLGGVLYAGLFNKYLLIKKVYKFGTPYETISEVLGWAQYYNDLTKPGKILVKILDWIDPKHCEKTRVYGILLAHKKLNLKKT